MSGWPFDPVRYAAALNRGIAFFAEGNIDSAIASFTEAASHAGSEVSAQVNLARILRMQGRAEEAQAWLRRALATPPAAAEAFFEVGVAFFEGHAYAEAAQAFSEALALQPAHREAGLQLVAATLNLNDINRAFEHLDRLAAHYPDDLDVARARLAASRGQPEVSLPAARAVLAHAPDDQAAIREVAVHAAHGKEKDAARAKLHFFCRRAPDDIEGWKSLALSVSGEDAHQASIDILEEGIAATDDPVLRLYRALLVPRIPWSNVEIDATRASMERHLDAVIDRASAFLGGRVINPCKTVNRTPYRLAYQGRNDRMLMEKLARAHLAVAPDLGWVSPHLARPRSPRRKIRIGFLSAFLEYHSVGKMVRKVIEDINRDCFEIVILRPRPARDDFARKIDAAADNVVVFPTQIVPARAAIAEADLDILFYADIGMEPLSYYLAFSRLARRQVVWPGHPVTTGLTSIDAYISGVTAEPADAQNHYTEKLVSFSAVPIYEGARPSRSAPDFRSKFNLPTGPLYVCAMTEQKFHPDFDDLLRRIFDRDPHANFAMVGRGDADTRRVQKRLSEAVPRLAGRLFTLPWLNQAEFTAFLHTADANLDTPHFSGSGTSRDAATLGVATVTIEGAYMRGRLTAGMYRDMGLPHLVQPNADAYADFAVRLANDPEYRARLAGDIRAGVPSLLLRKQLLADFENLFIDLMK